MLNFLNYTTEVIISMFLFFTVWKIFLQKETFHSLHRFFLLTSLTISFIIPAFEFILPVSNQFGFSNYITNTIQIEEIIIKPYNNSIYLIDWIALIYISVVLFLLIRLLSQLRSVKKFAKNCKIQIYHGKKIYITDKEISPFSFMNYIFFNKNDIKGINFNRIFQHELIHVNQKHSIDIILLELVIIFQWFNPMIYIYKKHLKTLHEYLSDEKVILQGFQADEYKMLLIKQQIGFQFGFANYFNKSLTLKRIIMINKLKSHKTAKLKLLLAIPVLTFTFLLFSFSGNKNETYNYSVSATQDTIYDQADEMPEFPGGKLALRRFLAENVKYPEIAKKNGEEGTVFIKFVVDKTGKVGDAVIQKGISKILDKEALIVINLLPLFKKPGYKNGKPVDVYYSIPITFSLK
ncbi:MAG: M56 family metallopeptidase [Bacteroidales bacterium]|nr:M56 family metallopeptidase [Bacteroidales bacterium]